MPVNGRSSDDTVSSPAADVDAATSGESGEDAVGVVVVGVVVGCCAAGTTVNVSVWSGSVRSFAALIVTV